MPRIVPICAVLLGAIAPAPAQALTSSILFRLSRATNGVGGMGSTTMGLGDINADGYGDFAVGDEGRRWVTAYSGRTGLPIWTFTAASSDRFGSRMVKVPDADNDGFRDVLVSTPYDNNSTGRVWLLSARTGALLGQLAVGSAGDQFGWSMAPVDDVNGDGRGDYIFGAPGFPGGAAWGRALVISGADFATVLADHQGFTAGGNLGCSVAAAGDIDNDGRGDYLVGEHLEGIAPGQVHCYSGRFRIQLYNLSRGTPLDGFGLNLIRPGDVDGNGSENLFVAFNGIGNGGIGVFELRTGAFMYQIPGGGGNGVGRVVTPLGDLDGDGAADYAVGMPARGWGGYPAGVVDIYSGRTATSMLVIGAPIPQPGIAFGAAIAVEDVDGDGRIDLVVGQPVGAPSGELESWVIALRKLPLTSRTHTLSISGGGRSTLDLDAGASNAGSFYWFLATASGQRPGFDLLGQHFPLNPDPVFLLFVSNINSPFLPTQLGVVDGAGHASCFFQLVPGLSPSLVGTTFDFAAVVFCPARFDCFSLASNARPVTLVP